MEELKYYLGFSVKLMGNTMFLSQLAYCIRILKRDGMEIAKAVSSPMVDNIMELFLEPLSTDREHK